jgi:hypothetical protein
MDPFAQTFEEAVTRPNWRIADGDGLEVLFPRHPQFDHHPFVPFIVDQEMALHENATAFFKVWAGNRFAPGTVGIEGC